MRLLNALTTALGQLLLSPFASFPVLGLLFWGAVLGIGFTFLFGKVSSQRRLRELSAQAKAQLLAIKLFRHDPLITLKCQGQLLKFAGLRLWYSLPAMLVMLIPSVLILVQMAQWYEYEPLPLGRSAVVDVRIAADQWNAYQDVVLEVPRGIALETDSLRDATQHIISWRIRPEEGGPSTLHWQLGSARLEKRLSVASADKSLMAVAARRPTTNWWDQVLNPLEPPCPADGPAVSVQIHHPRLQTPIWGWNVPWWAIVIAASVVAALISGRLLKVAF